MTLLLKQIFGLLKVLNSETGENQIAAGLALGLILGFSPFLSLQTLLVILLALLFRVQLGAVFLSGFFFKFIAFLADPAADALGRKVLEAPALRSLFVELYNMPIVPLTRFNNSIVMGSGVFGFCLVLPMFFVFKGLIVKYRSSVVERMKHTWAWKALQATAFYKWYATYDKLTG
jgi:uncharacterized protein (TIGR03546 family)